MERPEALIRLSDTVEKELVALERFLMEQFYMHPDLKKTANKVTGWLTTLFQDIYRDPMQMPGYFRGFVEAHGLERAVADYIAGMTDRYCLKLIERTNRQF